MHLASGKRGKKLLKKIVKNQSITDTVIEWTSSILFAFNICSFFRKTIKYSMLPCRSTFLLTVLQVS